MGSTGHGNYGKGRTADLNTDTFGIANAVPFKGKPPEGSNIKPPSTNNITLKINTDKGSNILFQFRLSKDNKTMTIIGFRDGVPQVKTKVAVDAGRPSLDKLIVSGKPSEKLAAMKMRELMNQSTQVSEGQLGAIADKLLRQKQLRK